MSKVARFFFLFVLIGCTSTPAQTQALHQQLYQNHSKYKESSIQRCRFKHSDIVPLLQQHINHPLIQGKVAGHSIEGRSIYQLKVGKGKHKILLWSQMHGDEPTATMALLDFFNFLTAPSDQFDAIRNRLLNNCTFYIIPMLNPDGAERFMRQNAIGIDLNRDALRLQTPEAQLLKQIHDEVRPDWGFNLHDQSRYYAAGKTNKPATTSFLAPAFDQSKSINDKRADAMRLIVSMNIALQDFIPGQVAQYYDGFEPRAFGDNIQKWGTRTILIEGGGQYNDRERQEVRQLHFVALLTAFDAIVQKNYQKHRLEDYRNIPYNNRSFHDLIIRKVRVARNGGSFLLDLAFRQEEVNINEAHDFYLKGKLEYIGDLSYQYAYEELDATGYDLVWGKVHPTLFETISDAQQTPLMDYLRSGYSALRCWKLPPPEFYQELPIRLIGEHTKLEESIELGSNPTFFLMKDGVLHYAVVNGQLYPLL